MKFLGIDYGTKRIGIAISDEGGKIAFPYEVFSYDATLVKKIKDLCEEKKIEVIVMGESKDFQGKDNPIMPAVYKLIENLKKETKLSVVFEPEFLTSKEASRIQGEHKKLDASAAAIILQSYLDKKKS